MLCKPSWRARELIETYLLYKRLVYFVHIAHFSIYQNIQKCFVLVNVPLEYIDLADLFYIKKKKVFNAVGFYCAVK